MIPNGITRTLAAIFLTTAVALGSTVRPAAADQAAATRNTILGVAALAIGIATATNVAHKNAEANNVVGYTRDGQTVYGDGHVVTASGQSYYPGNSGQQVSCSGNNCAVTGNGNGYNNAYANGQNGGYAWNGGRHRGYHR